LTSRHQIIGGGVSTIRGERRMTSQQAALKGSRFRGEKLIALVLEIYDKQQKTKRGGQVKESSQSIRENE